MDYSPILQLLFNALWYLRALVFVGTVIRSPWLKGKAEKAIVNLAAELFTKGREQL